MKSRIILTPFHAKRLMLALQDNIRKYEAQNGNINAGSDGGAQMPPMNFNTPKAQA